MGQRAAEDRASLASGGYGLEELERAGAYRVFEDPADFLKDIDELGARRRAGTVGTVWHGHPQLRDSAQLINAVRERQYPDPFLQLIAGCAGVDHEQPVEFEVP